ncbi:MULTISPECIES: hypothetical protein [Moorena]|uniref:hypothetical protein n=1 Tax=Moorena TaxID=1155738 RepID=UPI00030112D8|nr:MULTISPECIES: hypothetical protein [Moorena]NEQ15548.1 hypothetical protein [Moorena sp. SIO3E2]NEP34297.1 hypothetical protein [Moorena sp. SIO3B2]NEP67615.1 hypothetical protein [Moorena sp. SIO3A5]NEQ10180.1 hypothetical protein [Moorena sp. SIO4E2]NER86942.1 hypothetical protein [Moorena sp. SIO3A2]
MINPAVRKHSGVSRQPSAVSRQRSAVSGQPSAKGSRYANSFVEITQSEVPQPATLSVGASNSQLKSGTVLFVKRVSRARPRRL